MPMLQLIILVGEKTRLNSSYGHEAIGKDGNQHVARHTGTQVGGWVVAGYSKRKDDGHYGEGEQTQEEVIQGLAQTACQHQHRNGSSDECANFGDPEVIPGAGVNHT